MSLEEILAEAFEIAQTSTDPADHQYYLALQAVMDARLAEPQTPADITGVPPPPVSQVRIPRPKRQT
jgi:hypothetical protein